MRFLVKIATLILLLFSFLPLKSQNELRICDSIYRIVLTYSSDTTQLRKFGDATSDLAYTVPDTGYFYSSELFRLSDRINYRYGMAVALNDQGVILEQEDYRRSIEKYNLSLAISEQSGFSKLMSSSLNNLSIVYSLMGEYNKSIEYLLQLRTLAEKMKDTMRLAVALNNIGLRYYDMNSPEIALEYYYKAKELNYLTRDIERYATNLSNIGVAYQTLDLYDSAFLYHTRAIRLHQENNNLYKLQYGYQALAFFYMDKGEPKKAWQALDSAILLADEVNDVYGKINLLVAKASMLNKEEEFVEAGALLAEAENMALDMNYRSILVDLYKELTICCRGQEDYTKAFDYNEKYIALRDSLQGIEKNKALTQVGDYEKEKAEKEREVLSKSIQIQKLLRNFTIIVGGLFLIMLIGLWHRFRFVRRTKRELEVKNGIIENEKDRSDKLLLNILPSEIAEELKSTGKSTAKLYEMVTVLFTDFKGFSRMAEDMSPQQLVDEIDFCYRKFDEIITKYHVEKIKTIGDSYMCAGGLPIANKTNPLDTLKAACEMRAFMETYKQKRVGEGKPWFEARIGLHTGPVVAGIVGTRKFAYDIWGDTVNVASRMESGGEVGKINISQNTYEMVKDHFNCVYRGKVEVKNGMIFDMFFVEGPKV